jgi:hypothetical protein
MFSPTLGAKTQPPPPRSQGGRDHEIHNFCSPSLIDAISHACLVEIGSVVPEKKLKIFKSLRPTYENG